MRKRTFGARLATLFVVVMANIGCGDDNSGDAVAARVNSSSAFGSYHTFAFATADQSTPAGAAIPADVQSDLTLINDAVRDELVARNLTEVALSTPPDLVAVSLASTDSQQAMTWGCGAGYWWGYWDWSWDPCAWLQPLYVNYEVGTAFVGLVDRSAQNIAFAGVMQGVLAPGGDVEQRIKDDVHQMFKVYPEQ